MSVPRLEPQTDDPPTLSGSDRRNLKWDLGRFGKGARGSGPRERMVPLINNAGGTLRWFVEDVWGQLGDDHPRPGVPLLPSERKTPTGQSAPRWPGPPQLT
ncbi:hypothetical protein [Nonomuraea purpurea]|uniref:hypothetical protein n=1 Tax=Nonomuraea purpurea TaxID=1849276 RepID=UPI0036D24975